jgi:hypothetical protein
MSKGRLAETLAGLHEGMADPRVGFSDELRKQIRRLTNACMVPQSSFIFDPEPVGVPFWRRVQRPFAGPAGSPGSGARGPR